MSISRWISNQEYRPGRKKWEATRQFVDGWFDNVLGEVYAGNLRRLLGDEKLIRSAYHFYIREQIPSKTPETEELEVEPFDEEPDAVSAS